jgi:hypothetical protein
MALFQWFTKKAPAAQPANVDTNGLGQVDATQPADGAANDGLGVPSSAAIRKNERMERRELLYSVVRESMIRAGVLSSTFKFKVLSLDPKGRKYLIMMDLAKLHADEVNRLVDIEGQIAKTAKARHEILVTAVYWRINDQVSVATHQTPAPNLEEPVAQPSQPELNTVIQPRFDPLRPDEVAAFKQALSSIPTPNKLSAPGEILRSGKRNPKPSTSKNAFPAFEDTQLDERMSPLSGTQYGDLN